MLNHVVRRKRSSSVAATVVKLIQHLEETMHVVGRSRQNSTHAFTSHNYSLYWSVFRFLPPFVSQRYNMPPLYVCGSQPHFLDDAAQGSSGVRRITRKVFCFLSCLPYPLGYYLGSASCVCVC